MRTLLRLAASVVIGFLLLMPLGALYGAANLPVYHTWGLAHGSFTTALPALIAASFVALGWISWFGKADDAWPRLIACASVLALVTLLFFVDQESLYTMSLWHLGLYGALCVLFTLLCLRAEQPVLVPLFLLVPLLMDPVLGVLMTGGFDATGTEIFVRDLLTKILPATVATGLGVAFAKLLHSREA